MTHAVSQWGTVKYTPGPWKVREKTEDADDVHTMRIVPANNPDVHFLASTASAYYDRETCEANAQLIAVAPEAINALRLFVAWLDSEKSGPDYGSQCRNTHPMGEEIWKDWYGKNLQLCDEAHEEMKRVLGKLKEPPDFGGIKVND